MVRGKGTLNPDTVVMAYSEIPDVPHKFATNLQLGTSFEVMEFLAGQPIKLSQCMAEEHTEMQMTQRSLAGYIQTGERASPLQDWFNAGSR